MSAEDRFGNEGHARRRAINATSLLRTRLIAPSRTCLRCYNLTQHAYYSRTFSVPPCTQRGWRRFGGAIRPGSHKSKRFRVETSTRATNWKVHAIRLYASSILNLRPSECRGQRSSVPVTKSAYSSGASAESDWASEDEDIACDLR